MSNDGPGLYAIALAFMMLSVSMITSDSYRSINGELMTGDVTHEWLFDIDYTVTADDYNQYAVKVSQRNVDDDWRNFVTVTPLIRELADQLYRPGDEYWSATMALWFVSSIPYAFDADTYGVTEYWAYPMEMLYHNQGDCEDSAFLYISILKSMGISSELVTTQSHAYVLVTIDGITYRAEPTNGYSLMEE